MGLNKKFIVLENEITKQARDFKAKKEHCYALMSQLEKDLQQLREKNHTVEQIMDDLFRLQEDMAQRPTTRPTGAVVETQDNQYYPLEPTFKAVYHYSYTPRFDLHVETEKPPKNPYHEEMFKKLPVGFKMPKFDLYDGHGDPVAHLRGFCSKMRGAGGKDELLMAYFSQSLSGVALEWYTHQDHSRWYTWDDLAQAFARHFQYNIEIVPDCLSLTKIEKKPSESFREYGFRWREQPARVNCSMEENEMELIDTNQIEVQTPEAPNINQNPFPTHEETNMIEIVQKEGEPKKPSQSVMMIRSSEVKPVKNPTVGGLVNKLSMTNGEPSVVVKKISPSDVVAKQEKSKVVLPKLANKAIIIIEVTYKGKEVKEEVNEVQGLTHSGRCFTLEELRKAKTSKDNLVLVKKAVTKEEAEEFLRKMKVQDYSIVEQLRKMSAQISLLSLLIHSDEHRRALMKILNKAHVPDKISMNHLENIANKIFEVNMITFFDDELPVEGTKQNKALYLTDRWHSPWSSRYWTYNFLLGRPWIHAAKVVPSTLHQMVKFEWDRQEIVVHGEENLCAHSDAFVLFIEAEDYKGPWVYQVFKTMPVEKGIIQPVSLPENLGTFCLGFKPIEVLCQARCKKKRPVTAVPSSMIDIAEELIERFQRLFDDVDMVEVKEGSSKADVQFVRPNVKLNNWKATPLPNQKESW
ncbi:uncharacterized protein [Nicotiana sylvestris]|uniref:uncharacterized protein n=1 Tax=Nicotiana sylvestris TaxID=4096 RepID=UPI00388C5D8D